MKVLCKYRWHFGRNCIRYGGIMIDVSEPSLIEIIFYEICRKRFGKREKVYMEWYLPESGEPAW
jgi:hypothetical protein